MRTRNRLFRLAALLAAAAYLMLTARYSIEAEHLARELAPGGYLVGASFSVALHLFGAGGFVLVALGFGTEVDWRRLRIGGTVLAATAIADFVGWVFRLIATLANTHDHDYRAFHIWTTVGMLLGAVAVGVVASGFASSRQGRPRAVRLRVGAIAVAAGYLVAAVGELYLQSLYSAAGYVHELTIGTLVEAIGVFGLAVAGLFFARAATRPLDGREAGVFGAASVAAVATICIGAGEVLVGIPYASNGAAAWVMVIIGLGLTQRLAVLVAFVCLALGARAAATPARST
jgi:hypothetical protein